MKKSCWVLFLAIPLLLRAQPNAHALEKLWETDTIVPIPESVLPDANHTQLYVSLIDGGGWDEDGKGGVGKLSLDGKHLDAHWFVGMNAPKGLGLYKNRLYVADISHVVVMDVALDKIVKIITIPGANGLNDITVDDKGIVFVSDSKAGKVYRIENDIPKLYMDDLPGANGLKATKDGLYILARKAVLLAGAGKQLKTITTLPNGGDGVEEAGNGDLIVSEWLGIVYYVYADGRKEVLLDTHEQKRNTADIHYDIDTHILYIPGFNTKTVSAYKLVNTKPSASLLWSPQRLAECRGKPQLVASLRAQADRLLDLPLLSVMDKSITPPSGSKHDYMSQAPYFWYDSSKPNGLPYIRRDGQRNPEIYKITDHKNLAELGSQVQTLALASYLTGNPRYAANAAERLRHWFTDEATRMNPNLEYGQGIPGINTGRGIGIIETIPLIGIADAATLLESVAANARTTANQAAASQSVAASTWTTADANALRQWYSQYLQWLLTSKNGQEEHAAANNHGTWYLAQATAIALYTGDLAKAHTLAEEGKAKMDHQIQADGRMPEELARTNGLGYSTYNLQAFFTLARLAGHAGVDLWTYTDAQQGGIHAAFNWLLPYALGQKAWEYQQIGGYNKEDLYSLLLQAYPIYSDANYLTDAQLIHPNGGNPLTEIAWGL